MKVTYTGGNGEFSAADKTRLEAKLAKLGKMIDKKGEKTANVILTTEKRGKKSRNYGQLPPPQLRRLRLRPGLPARSHHGS